MSLCFQGAPLRRTVLWRLLSPRRSYASQECAMAQPQKGLILGVYENESEEHVFTDTAARMDEKMGGKLTDLLKTSTVRLRKGKGITFTNVDDEIYAVALVGLGHKGRGYNELEAIHEGMEAARAGAGLGCYMLEKHNIGQVMVEPLGHPEQAAEGAGLAVWRYQEFKSEKKWKVIPTLEMHGDADEEVFQRGLYKAESQNLARRLSDCAANIMTPLRFAQECVNELCPCGVKVDVHDRDWIERHKMNALMAVARGSCEPPLVLAISYCGGPEEQKPIVLIGKGITYDSGGVCLKKCKGMARYRGDLAGAAAIVGAIRTASALSLPSNVYGLIPLCENMVSGMAMKCGDVVMGLNGKSISITDTDNEGRLILADAMIYAQKALKPRLMIDVATLTPSHGSALGSAASGVYSNSQTMWAQTRRAGIITGDRVWRLPLWKYYKKKVTGFASHDVDNKGKGRGGSPLAAAFLNEFVVCVDWLHFDTSGCGMIMTDKVYPYYRKGRMTGRPTRTLVQLLYQLSCPEEGARDVNITC